MASPDVSLSLLGLLLTTGIAALRRIPGVSDPGCTCGSCTYDLTGLAPSGLCPECGATYPSPLAPSDPKFILLMHRLPAIAAAWLFVVLVPFTPWLYADGHPIALADLGRSLRELEAGRPLDAVQRMTRNRAFARRGDLSASNLMVAPLCLAPLWSFLPGWKRALPAVAAYALLIHAAVVLLGYFA